MPADRFVVLGLALARSPWFRSVAQWSNSASIPVEFVKCMSAIEVKAHLVSGRPFSALLVDGAASGLDRDLIDEARSQGCAVIIVDDIRMSRDWIGIGASAVVNPMFQRADLVETLTMNTARIGRGDDIPDGFDGSTVRGGAKVAMVCGPGGTGASTAAIALAQGLCEVAPQQSVLLADFVLHAEQAMLHDARDIVPGIQELVEAHRTARPTVDELPRFTFDVPERGYQLLLGLRRAHNWGSLRPRAFAAAVDSVCSAWQSVICDTDPDLEGEAEGGSSDVEDRHLMARTVAAKADVAFVVAHPTMKGIHGLVRVVRELLDHDVPAERIVPVINLAPKAGRPRADLAKAVASLLQGAKGSETMPSPIFLPQRPIDDVMRDGVRLPTSITGPLAAAFAAVAGRASAPRKSTGPKRIAAGSLGHWATEATEPA